MKRGCRDNTTAPLFFIFGHNKQREQTREAFANAYSQAERQASEDERFNIVERAFAAAAEGRATPDELELVREIEGRGKVQIPFDEAIKAFAASLAALKSGAIGRAVTIREILEAKPTVLECMRSKP